jgi:hypothetical protein
MIECIVVNLCILIHSFFFKKKKKKRTAEELRLAEEARLKVKCLEYELGQYGMLFTIIHNCFFILIIIYIPKVNLLSHMIPI